MFQHIGRLQKAQYRRALACGLTLEGLHFGQGAKMWQISCSAGASPLRPVRVKTCDFSQRRKTAALGTRAGKRRKLLAMEEFMLYEVWRKISSGKKHSRERVKTD
jgi:hypothetical protein